MKYNANEKNFTDIIKYIYKTWHNLTRSVYNLSAFHDIKIGASGILYFPHNFKLPRQAKFFQEKNKKVKIAFLPKPIRKIGDVKIIELKEQGLLYLPKTYVVPGGQFNEMYGWDSYFIILGLLQSKKHHLALNMLENYFFEIEYYGGILNANRSYHLSRSQPPFLSSAVLAIYKNLHNLYNFKLTKPWLERAYNYIIKDYNHWQQSCMLAADTGLSRYYDAEDGPLIEVAAFPEYYKNVVKYGSNYPDIYGDYLRIQGPNVNLLNPLLPYSEFLTDDYFKGDRSLRASGFDITNRFGPLGGKTHHYAPVCLNSLLFKTEKDLSHIAKLLNFASDAKQWEYQAKKRRECIFKYLWNPDSQMFFDYNFILNKISNYKYATTFFPLWAGLATNIQAAGIARNLIIFEQPGGLTMSDIETGVQWDKPFGWAPINLLAIKGLFCYNYIDDAHRLAYKFTNMIYENFLQTGNIYEKYNVVNRSAEIVVRDGYQENAAGFGWTNAVYLQLYKLLNRRNKKKNASKLAPRCSQEVISR